MMPENKPMKMQWLNIDGRQVPSILPQVWNPDINDWEVTGSDKPLPTQDSLLLNKLNELDQKIDGIIDGTTPVPTQLTGSSVELINQRLIVGQKALATVVLTENLSNYKNIIIAIRTNATPPIEWEISASGYNNDDDMRGLIHKSGSSTGFVTDNGGVCFEIPVISNTKMEIVFRHDRSFAIYADYVVLGVS